MPSSPWNYISPLWTVKQFAIETDNGWGRSQLRRIDRQLAAAKATEGNPDQYIKELAKLVDECSEWMISKEKKFANKPVTRSYEKRLKAITTLMNQALQHLKFFAFEGRKARGAEGGLVRLKPGFDRERRQFEDMKLANPWNKGLALDPHSSSYVAAGLGTMREHRQWYENNLGVGWLLDKSVDTLTEEEFQWISKRLQYDFGSDLGGVLRRVHYIRKRERINNNMLIPLGGLLYKDSGRTPYNSAGCDGKDIYAMDKYGNLMSIPDDRRFDHGNMQSEHRHSSLNAGNDVICAGYIKIEQGVIKYIDNKSGHYKPTEKNLASAVLILMDQHDLNLDQTRIRGWVTTGPNRGGFLPEIVGGVLFTNAVVPPPPYPPPY